MRRRGAWIAGQRGQRPGQMIGETPGHPGLAASGRQLGERIEGSPVSAACLGAPARASQDVAATRQPAGVVAALRDQAIDPRERGVMAMLRLLELDREEHQRDRLTEQDQTFIEPAQRIAHPARFYRWVERAYPALVHYNKLDKGGHFAAWEQPKLFSEEVRAGFRSLRT